MMIFPFQVSSPELTVPSRVTLIRNEPQRATRRVSGAAFASRLFLQQHAASQRRQRGATRPVPWGGEAMPTCAGEGFIRFQEFSSVMNGSFCLVYHAECLVIMVFAGCFFTSWLIIAKHLVGRFVNEITADNG